MNLLILGSVAGGVSGALGYLLAGSFHGKDLGEKIYPLYAATLFGLVVLTIRYISL